MYVKLDPMRLARAARGRVRRVAGTARRDESGFTVTESVTAIFILMLVVLALVSSVTMAIRGVLTGKQRTTALSIAEEIMEEIRAVKYDRVGHDLSDATLTNANSHFWFDGTNYRYDPNGVAGEPLAVAKDDAVVGGPSGAIAGHYTSGEDDATPWEVWVYITHVDTAVAGGDAHKRVTIEVIFDNEQFDVEDDVDEHKDQAEAVENRAKISTLVFPSDSAPTDLVNATAESDAGMATITGAIHGTGLQSLTVTYPHTFAELRSHQFRDLSGWSQSAHSQVVDNDGVVATGGCTASGTTATCPMSAPLSLAVSDDASGLARYGVGSETASVGTFGNSTYEMNWDGGTVDGELSTCYGAGVLPPDCGLVFGGGGASDTLPYQLHEGDGPNDFGMPLTIDLDDVFNTTGVFPDLTGSLVSFSGANHSESEIDTDNTLSGQTDKTTPTANITAPSFDVVTLNDPLGLLPAVTVVSVTAVDVTATAPVGPSSAEPSISAAPVTVTVGGVELDPTLPGGGDVEAATGTVEMDELIEVAYDVDVTTGIEDTGWGDPSGARFITESHAHLTDALRVVVDVQIVVCPSSSIEPLCTGRSPRTVADVTLDLDYGDLSTEAVLALP